MTEAITGLITTGATAILQRIILRPAKERDVLDLRIEFLEEQRRKLEERLAQAPAQGCTACSVSSPRILVAPSPENAPEAHVEASVEAQPTETAEEQADGRNRVACLPCARAHFSGAAGSLKEAIRFAREGGIKHPEVQTRLQSAEEELIVTERHDWTPEKILNAPAQEKGVIRIMLPKLRELRQDVVDIKNVEDLESAAAKAGDLATALRVEVLKTEGTRAPQPPRVVPQEIIDLAQRVQSGELTLDQAKAQIRARYGQKEAAGS